MTQFVPINRTQHANQGWHKAKSISFAIKQTAVPVVLDELPHLIPSLPLAFIKHTAADGSDHFQLVALLSITPSTNLFAAPNGRWLGGYLPADFRAYPFRLIPEPTSGERVLCFDQDSDLMTSAADADGGAFYDEKGEISTELKRVLSFLKQYEQNRQLTQIAVDTLAKMELITSWPINITTANENSTDVQGIYRIDEPALRELSGECMQVLANSNALSLAYAQLFSQHRLSGLSKLYELHARAERANRSLSEQDVEGMFGSKDDTLKFDF